MNIPLLFLLLALTFSAIICYMAGTRKIKKLRTIIASELEEAIQPIDKEYINIGGYIGYHANFVLNKIITSIKTTFTFLPRHSLFFFPLSRLLTKHDKLYLTFLTEKKINGEAHLLRKSISNSRNHTITNAANLSQEKRIIQGKEYILYFENKEAKIFIENLMPAINAHKTLHICAYPGNKNFYMYLIPTPGTITQNVKAMMTGIKQFLKADD